MLEETRQASGFVDFHCSTLHCTRRCGIRRKRRETRALLVTSPPRTFEKGPYYKKVSMRGKSRHSQRGVTRSLSGRRERPIKVSIHTHIHIHIHTYTHVHIHMQTYTHTHTHPHALLPGQLPALNVMFSKSRHGRQDACAVVLSLSLSRSLSLSLFLPLSLSLSFLSLPFCLRFSPSLSFSF